MSAKAVKWIFELSADYEYNIRAHLPADFSQACAFVDKDGHRRLEIDADGTARVLAGYAWDGCTPKLFLCDLVIGTPDGVPNAVTRKPKAYYASLLHDVLYQFLWSGDLPVTRAAADRIFLDILTRDDFAPRRLYYLAVRLFGGGFRRLTGWRRRYAGRRIERS